uniref:hypothetical protein n=1 Tax=Elmerina hispida TaxID=1245649 RepID=UPI0030027259|nr:hypothetical protein [Elmerina hispida]
MPNSLMLFKNRYFSSTSTVYSRDTYGYMKEQGSLKWPTKWVEIEKKVHEDQMKLAALAETVQNIYDPKVLSFQRKMALSLNFRFVAVRQVTLNAGAETAGVDNITIDTLQEKLFMVEELKKYILEPNTYKACPVRRVMIPNANSDKKRPLGIPTFASQSKDRCLQALVNLILVPLVEVTSDEQSFGFRKYRNAKMAIGAVRRNLRSEESHYDK